MSAIPISEGADWKIRSEAVSRYAILFPGIFCLVLSAMLFAISPLVAFSAMDGVFIIFTPLYFWRKNVDEKKRTAILMEDQNEYFRSRDLEKVFEGLRSVRSSDFPVTESSVGSGWRPFRVEHFLSESIRGEISGVVRFWGGRLSGNSRGSSTPNLLDSSSIVFLKNDNGETLRALIPSPRVTREMVAAFVENSKYGLPWGSHTLRVINRFHLDQAMLVDPISHPDMLDAIDSSCELAIADRPEVEVVGELIQPGVVVATALKVGDRHGIFLPSGFLRELASRVSPVIEKKIEAPPTLAAVS